ncbi:MAG: FtsX-like permease family protein [Bacteroidales bacterium]
MRYFKQSWQVIKQNRLFSGVYIVGTALAIAMVMAYAIVWYVKIAPVSPEVNRGRTLYMGYLAELTGENSCMSSSMAHPFIETVFPQDALLPEIECVVEYSKEDKMIYSQEVPEGIKATVHYTTTDICKVFDYRFLYGAPFTRDDVVTAAKKIFITKSYARRLFATEDAVGKTMTLDFDSYTVCGVVKDISGITPVSYANIWVPITCMDGYGISNFGELQVLGDLSVIILARSSKDVIKIKEDVAGKIKQINSSLSGVRLENYGQPDTHFYSIFRRSSNSFPKLKEHFTNILLMLMALLLVPAVNLAGIIASGMEGRLEELGIRKAFGASRGKLLWQILCENLLLTLMGGFLGLFLSYLIVWGATENILQIVNYASDFSLDTNEIFVTPGMLFNPIVFIMTFLVCLLLNTLAATIPAAISLRKDIIYSLTSDKK